MSPDVWFRTGCICWCVLMATWVGHATHEVIEKSGSIAWQSPLLVWLLLCSPAIYLFVESCR